MFLILIHDVTLGKSCLVTEPVTAIELVTQGSDDARYSDTELTP